MLAAAPKAMRRDVAVGDWMNLSAGTVALIYLNSFRVGATLANSRPQTVLRVRGRVARGNAAIASRTPSRHRALRNPAAWNVPSLADGSMSAV